MVGEGVVSELGAWPCRGICSEGVAANSLQCTPYVYRRRSGVKVGLQAVSATFVCKTHQGEHRQAGYDRKLAAQRAL